jgi:hypothetical protein
LKTLAILSGAPLALNRRGTVKIVLLAAATALSLGVDAAYADNKGNANTQYPQIILEAAPKSPPEVTPAPATPVVPVVPRTQGWQQDGQLILLY